MFQYSFYILRTTDHNWKFDTSTQRVISQSVTAFNAPGLHGVDELKLKLSLYSNFYNRDAQQEVSEYLLLLMDIMDKERVCSLFYW